MTAGLICRRDHVDAVQAHGRRARRAGPWDVADERPDAGGLACGVMASGLAFTEHRDCHGAALGEIAFGVISPERHRPVAGCAADLAQGVAATPQVLHDVDWMHPQPVGERPYGNSSSASSRTMMLTLDISRPLKASTHAAKEPRWQTTCAERLLLASFGHSAAFFGLTAPAAE